MNQQITKEISRRDIDKMKIKLLSSLLIMSLIFINSVGVKSDTELIPQDQQPSVMELAFIRELGPSILEAMSAHGDLQLFDSTRIEKIIRNKQEDQYDVTLRFVGYQGPLNPPYKLIRITFRIPGDYSNKNKVVFYEHKSITNNEAEKLGEYTD